MLNICLYGEVNPDSRLYISDPNPNPHVVPNGYWSRFYKQAFADGTAFSSVANIDSVYAPIAFTQDVDLANVADFFTAHRTVLANSNAERYAVGTIAETVLTQAYANVDDPTDTVAITEGGEYQVVIVGKDTEGNVGVGTIIGSDLTVKHWPPLDGTTTTGTVTGVTNDWSISGASYGDGTYRATSSIALHYTYWCPYALFSGNNYNGSSWHSPSGTTTGIVTLESPTPFVLTRYALYSRYDSFSTGEAQATPKNWTIDGSNDGSTWVTIDTQINQSIHTPATRNLSYDISNSTSYKYYRLNVTANNGSQYLILGQLRLYGTDPVTIAFPAISTLNTTITTAEFNKTLQLSGQVVASTTDGATTSFKAFATTQPNLTPDQVRDLINDPVNADAVYNATESGDFSEGSAVVTVPKVMDLTGNVYDSSAVNYAHVYLYGTDGVNEKHDALSTQTIVAGDNLPYVTIPNSYWSRFYKQSYADGTAFSSVANIDSVYAPIAFTQDVDLANVADFFTAHRTVLANSNAERYAVKQLEETVLTHAYANIDDPTDTMVITEGGEYQVVIAGKDVDGNVGIGTILPINEIRQWPPTDGTTTIIGTLGQNSTWSITGSSYGYGEYKSTSNGALHAWSSYAAFDNIDSGASWHTAIGVRFGILGLESPIPFVLDHYTLRHRKNSYTETMSPPKDWIVEGSNDNSTWTTLDTQINQTMASNSEAFKGRTYYIIGNTTAYKYHRLNVSSNNGQSFVIVGDWLLFEKHVVYFSTPLSDLSTTITTAEFNKTLQLTGQVVASTTVGATTIFKAFATTQQGLTPDQVRDLINDPVNAAAVYNESDFTEGTAVLTVPKVLADNGAVYDSSAVNYAHVYLYGTDGVNAKNDALSYASIVAGDNLPHVDVTNVSSAVTSGVLTVTGTVFSGFANVTGGVRAAVFDPASFDLAGADQSALASFVNANGTDLGITSDQYAVGSFTDFSLSTYFSNIDAGYTTGSLVDGSAGNYRVAVSAMDTTGNVGVVRVTPSFINSLIDYTSLSRATLNTIGYGWTQIKYLPGGSTTWFPGNDNLKDYGGTEFLFTTGDFSNWLIADQFQVNGESYGDALRTITRSSISASPYQVRWLYRPTVHNQDPWVSVEDHIPAYRNGTIMYGENSFNIGGYENIIHPTGHYVFVR
jgi:hypothetical protein